MRPMRAAGGNGRHHMKCKATHMLATGSGETQDHGGEASQWVEFSEVDISDFEKPNPKTLKRGWSQGWNRTNCGGDRAKMNGGGGGAGRAVEPGKKV